MTATVILYIGFLLYNCLKKTAQMVWKTWKTRGISFCQICNHPVIARTTVFCSKYFQIPQLTVANFLQLVINFLWLAEPDRKCSIFAGNCNWHRVCHAPFCQI